MQTLSRPFIWNGHARVWPSQSLLVTQLPHPAPGLPPMTRVCNAMRLWAISRASLKKEGSHYRRLYSSSRLLKPRKIRLLSSQFLVVSFWRERHCFIHAFILSAWNGYLQETFHSVGSMQEEEGANWVKELTWPSFSIQKLSLSTRAYCSSLTRDLRAVERKCMHSIRSSCEVLNWWLDRSLCSFVFASLSESQCFSKTFQLSSMKRSFFVNLALIIQKSYCLSGS